MKKKIPLIIILIIFALFLNGCSSKKQESNRSNNVNTDNQTIYSVVKDSTSYTSFSNNGLDYMYPPLNEKWKKEELGEENIKYSTNGSVIYLLRNLTVTDVDSDSFTTILNGKDIPGYLQEQITKYIGKLEMELYELSYSNDLKFWNTSGMGKSGGKEFNYQAMYFQTNLSYPSVKRQRVPTAFIVVYEYDSDTPKVEKMLNDIQYNMVYAK